MKSVSLRTRRDGASVDASKPPDAAGVWQVRGRAIELDRPRILGIVNVTPDSFSDGGRFLAADAAVEHGGRLIDEGADIVDVGGESTRPQGATPVSAANELARVVPVVEELAARYPTALISVDTVKSKVADAALSAGAHIINDVSGFRLDSRMAAVCAAHGAGVVVMHSRGDVQDMATHAHAVYGDDPVGEVGAELLAAVRKGIKGGVRPDAIVIDPGLGFSKLQSHTVAVLRELTRLSSLGYPLAVGASRKRFIGELSGVHEPAARVFGSVAACVVALMSGAILFRVHDVLATRQALDVAWGIISNQEG